jgi:cysteine synthase
VRIYAKLEGQNPAGSIKDRLAYYLIQDGINKKLITKKKIILEATSGNTGIGLAMMSAKLGLKFLAVMPSSVSQERKSLIKSYGADVLLTDGEKGTNFALETAINMQNESPKKYVMLDQFSNPANPLSHYETTGLEIINSIPNITHFVAGMGTGGTLMGVGRRLKEYNSSIKVIGIEPKIGLKIPGLRNMSAFTPPIFNYKNLDETLLIDDDSYANSLTKDLLENEGVSAGPSSGATLWGSIEISRKIMQGVIVTIFPDKFDRYISNYNY